MDMPRIFVVADEISLGGQRRFVRATQIQLTLLFAAGAASAVSWVESGLDLAALFAGLAFVGAALFRVNQLTGRPYRQWYEGRAAAESAKTLAWLYAVGGSPFVRTAAADRAETLLTQNLRHLAADLPSVAEALQGTDAFVPTESMRHLRDSLLENRRSAYRRDRVRDQEEWYRRKSDYNARRAKLWGRCVLAFECVGAVGAFLVGFGVVDLDLMGLAGAAAAASVAWLETKQHHTLSSAYRLAAEELSHIDQMLDQPANDEDWARFVADSEQAISREHTLWRARSRGFADLRALVAAPRDKDDLR